MGRSNIYVSKSSKLRSLQRMINFFKSKSYNQEPVSLSISGTTPINIEPASKRNKLVIQQVQTTSIPPKPVYHPAIIRACLSMFGKKPAELDSEETARFMNYRNWKLHKGEPIEQEILYNPAGGNQPCLHCNLPT